MPSALKTYWTKGPGAAIIRWGQPGDFNRCVAAIQKEATEDGHPMSDRMVKGLCSNLHVVATGGRPGTEKDLRDAVAFADDGWKVRDPSKWWRRDGSRPAVGEGWGSGLLRSDPKAGGGHPKG